MESMDLPEQLVILLVEDREDDILLIQRALAEAKVQNPLHIVRDGEEAMAYFQGDGKYARREEFPLPDLVLLDLKMPRVDGFELLQWIRRQPSLKTLRVVVLTSSGDIFDINRAYELGANSFLVKPLEFINYPAMMRTLSSFWLKHSKAPEVDRSPNLSSAPPEPDHN